MRHPVPLTATLSCILLLRCACAFALDPSLDINQYTHTIWKVRDGFPRGEVYSIAQTPDGYLWLGTEFGLFRFDGVKASLWQPPADLHLPDGPILTLRVSRDGTLWIGGKGLASWKNDKLTDYRAVAGQFVYALMEDHDGTLWVGTGGGLLPGRLCAIRGSSFQCYGEDGGLSRAVMGLYEDRRGSLWVGVQNGLWKWKPGQPKFYPLAEAPDTIRAIAEDVSGALLVGWKNGIYLFVDGKTEGYSSSAGQFHAYRMLRDRNGGLWVGTEDRGLLHIHEGKTDVFSQKDGFSGDAVSAIFEDSEGSIWVSSLQGLDRFRDPAAATFSLKQGLSHALVGSILADKSGNVWMGTYGGLNREHHGKITIPATGGVTRNGDLNGSPPSSLLEDHLGRFWVSTLHQLGTLENGRFRPLAGFPAGHVLSMAEDTQENLWAANEDVGLIKIFPRGEVRKISWSDLGHKAHASVLAADQTQGGLWLGFFEGGISYFSDGKVRKSYTTADGLGPGRVSDFYFDKEGTLWISTESGLSRLKNSRLATLTSKNGLPCDTVHWAIEDDDQSMWLYTACGLVRIVRSELEAWSTATDSQNDRNRRIQAAVFDNSDGIRSLASPGHYHPQVAKTPDGKIWFLPWDGVSVIDPRHLPFNKLPPPVHIGKITADGKTYDPSDGLPLPARVRDVTIDYTALSLVAPEKIHFRYKLEGQDPDWREVVNDRQVQYSNLVPRHYTFRVMASNNSGVWNEAGASLEFSVLPAFYQTTWFRILCGFGLLTLLWSIYQLRIQHMQRQFNIALDARVNERTRIARELHDTLLQTFHGAMLQFQAARNLMSRRPEEALRSLDDAIGETKKALGESRQAIQDLRSEPIAQGNLAEFLMSICPELADSSANEHPPVFNLVEEGERQPLSSKVSSEICRIALELMRNAYRHARAQRIEAEVRYGDSMFRLRIRDNGKGIDSKVLKEGGRAGHWGLRGVRERAERIGARVELWSEPAGGTEVQLLVPASIAYESLRDSYRIKLFGRMKRGA